jgi:SMC interacting uncharacterized protein involved in chromosome segregation
MNISHDLRDQFLTLKATALEILLLDLEDEASIARLEQLQVIQRASRDQIEHICFNSPPSEKNGLTEVISDCAELELKIKDKLENYQNTINEHIFELKQAEFARRKYQSAYTQSEGFFLDEHH